LNPQLIFAKNSQLFIFNAVLKRKIILKIKEKQMADKTKKLMGELTGLFKEATILSSCEAVLGWDERTYMPRKGAESRANALALLAGMVHEKITNPRIGDIINELENGAIDIKADTIESANIREMRRDYDLSVKLPKALVEELSKTVTLAQNAWQEARAKNDFDSFKPHFEKVIKLKQQSAEHFGYEGSPYNAMLDIFEPGMTTEDVTKIFADLRNDLVELLGKIESTGNKPDTSILHRDFPETTQQEFGMKAASAIGFDFEAGRLDKTTHPFCTGFGPGDTRITTRYNEKFFNAAFFGIMHEAGHGIYDQGLPVEHYGTPAGESISLGIHESQSRMWENMVGRSKPFWKHFFPVARGLYSKSLKDVDLDTFYFAINEVKPSFIRVEADEATYNLHILLRFELESGFFNGDIKLDDVPFEWNERFEKYFGIKPPDNAQGCLQDVHWSAGLIGYFPTYTLGNLYSAQFFAKADKDLGGLDKDFEKGEFNRLLGWLRKNIHEHGKRYRADELVKKVTGEPLSHKYLIDYMTKKFGELYGF
jgi:carboxypeptidase Taq